MECKYKSGGAGNGLCKRGCHIGHYAQLNVYDYLADIPGNNETTDLVEVQFKHTRKGYYHNVRWRKVMWWPWSRTPVMTLAQ